MDGTGTNQVLLVIQDVTQQRQDEKRIRETMDALQRESRLAAIGLMITGMTHELNNPLGVILGYSELALKEPIVEPVRHYIETIHEATERASKIVHNVLAFGREGAMDKQGVGVRAMIERVVGLKSHELMVDNIKVTLSIPPDVPAIEVDPFQMVQALLNIITNAQQAMKEAHGEGEIVIHASTFGDRVRIIFEDNGPGISPEHVGKVFDPFFTTKGIGEGTGLGLSVTHGIVRQHSGDIWAENIPGRGARLCLEIPASPLQVSEKVKPLVSRPEQVAETRLQILVVNDQAPFRELLTIALSEEGY